jgi:hypothetical protein
MGASTNHELNKVRAWNAPAAMCHQPFLKRTTRDSRCLAK